MPDQINGRYFTPLCSSVAGQRRRQRCASASSHVGHPVTGSPPAAMTTHGSRPGSQVLRRISRVSRQRSNHARCTLFAGEPRRGKRGQACDAARTLRCLRTSLECYQTPRPCGPARMSRYRSTASAPRAAIPGVECRSPLEAAVRMDRAIAAATSASAGSWWHGGLNAAPARLPMPHASFPHGGKGCGLLASSHGLQQPPTARWVSSPRDRGISRPARPIIDFR